MIKQKEYKLIVTAVVSLMFIFSMHSSAQGYTISPSGQEINFRDSILTQVEGYHLYEVIEEDVNGDEEKEFILIYRTEGTGSLLMYQVWGKSGGQWELWLEKKDIYRGTVEVKDSLVVEKIPIYAEGDANALPSSHLERRYEFTREGDYLVREETKQQVSIYDASGGWKNPPREVIEEMLTRAALEKGVPPVLLKSIAYVESRLRQFDEETGEPLLSFDGVTWGIMQVFPRSQDPEYLEKLKYDIEFNIQEGADILLEKWGFAFSSRPVIPRVGEGDPRLLESWYFALWAYNGWCESNNPNMIPYEFSNGWEKLEAYQEKVIRTAKSEFGQEINPISPEQLPEVNRPGAETFFEVPQPSHGVEYRIHEPGEILVDRSPTGLVLRDDSWQPIGSSLKPGTRMQVLEGPVLYQGYMRYKIKTIEVDKSQERVGWVAMNWAVPWEKLSAVLGVERKDSSNLQLTAGSTGGGEVQYRFDYREMGIGNDYETIRDYSPEPDFTWTDAVEGKLYEIVVHVKCQDDYEGYYVVFGNTDPDKGVPFEGLSMGVASKGNEIHVSGLPKGGSQVIYALQYRKKGGEYTSLDPSNPYQASPEFVKTLDYGEYEIVVHAIDMAGGLMEYYGSYMPFQHQEN